MTNFLRDWRHISAARWGLIFSMLLLTIYYIETPGIFEGKYSGDGVYGFHYLDAILYHHTLDMYSVMPDRLPLFGRDPITKLMPNRCPFGPVLVWLPFYLVAVAMVAIANLAGALRGLDPGSPFHAWMVGLGTLTFVLFAYRQLFVLLKRHTSETAAFWGSAVAIWATPIAWYSTIQPCYQHGLAFAFVVFLIERWDARRGQTSSTKFIELGLLAGLAASMRAQEIFFAILPLSEIGFALWRRTNLRAWLIGAIWFGAATLVALAPQLFVWWSYTHQFRPVQAEPIRWLEPEFITALFSTRAGFFPWTPIAYATLLGFCLCRRPRHLFWPLAVVFLLDLYLCASAWLVTGGFGFGSRRLSDQAPFLALGVALLYVAVRRPWQRSLVVGFSIACIALCWLQMEGMRSRKLRSSGSMAHSIGMYLEELGLPEWTQNVADKIGSPFVQPAGWLFALSYHVPVSTFEGVWGNSLLERDGQWFQLNSGSLAVDWNHRWHFVDGVTIGRQGRAQVTGQVRALMPLFAREPFTMILYGDFTPGEMLLFWRGHQVRGEKLNARAVRFTIAEEFTRHGMNEVRLSIPVGSLIEQFNFAARSEYLKKYR